MAFPAVPAMGSRRPGGLLNVQTACDGSVLKKCQCSGPGWKVEACACWPGSPRAAGVTRELPPCRRPLQPTPINTQGSPSRKCPRMFIFFKYPLAPERTSFLLDTLWWKLPFSDKGMYLQPPKTHLRGVPFQVPGGATQLKYGKRRAGAAAVPWPWCLRSARRGQCCPPGHAVVNSWPGGATLRYSAFSAVGPLKMPFSLPSLGKKSCW